MRGASIISAAVALVTGLIAAWYWFRSSGLEIDPMWPKTKVDTSGLKRGTWAWRIRLLSTEVVLPENWQLDFSAATKLAFLESGRLNSIAALWTAISVVSSAVSSIVGAIA
jgi:hypothetical protein